MWIVTQGRPTIAHTDDYADRTLAINLSEASIITKRDDGTCFIITKDEEYAVQIPFDALILAMQGQDMILGVV